MLLRKTSLLTHNHGLDNRVDFLSSLRWCSVYGELNSEFKNVEKATRNEDIFTPNKEKEAVESDNHQPKMVHDCWYHTIKIPKI